MGWQDAPIDPTVEPPAPPLPSGEAGTGWDSLYSGLTLGYGDEIAGAMAGGLSKLSGGDYQPAYANTRDYVRARNEDYATQHPYLNAAGNVAGGLALPLGLVGDVARARPLATAVGLGGVAGFGRGEGGVENRLTDAAIGMGTGAATYGAVRGAQGMLGTVFPAIGVRSQKPDFQRGMKNLQANDITVTPAEQIGSQPGRLAERASAGYFGGGGAVEERPFKLHSKLMEMSNFAQEDVNTGELSQDAVRRAQQNFNRDYGKALNGVRVNLRNMDPYLQQLEVAKSPMLGFENRARLNEVISDFRHEVGQNRIIGGNDYQRLRSQIGTLQDAAYQSDRDKYLAPVYRGLKNILDNAYNQSVAPARARFKQNLDRQYGGFLALKKAEGNPEAIGTMANALWSRGQRINPEFVRLARDYQKVILRGGYQSSGTAENTQTMGDQNALRKMMEAESFLKASTQLAPPISSLRALGTRYQAGPGRTVAPIANAIPVSPIAALAAANTAGGRRSNQARLIP